MFQNEVSYTGAISDSTTGLTYMNARYSNPAIGSFTSQDTYLGSAYSPWTQHLYSYTGGNPINFIDPTGHRFVEGTEIGGHVEPSTQSYSEYEASHKDEKVIEEVISDTDGFGGYVNLSFILRFSISIEYVSDGHGNEGILMNIAPGVGTAFGATAGAIYTHTNALDIYDLEGWSVQTGGGVGIGPASSSADYIGTVGSYSGYELTTGGGVTLSDLTLVYPDVHADLNYSFFVTESEASNLHSVDIYGNSSELNYAIDFYEKKGYIPNR